MSLHLRIAIALLLLSLPVGSPRRADAQSPAAAILAGVDSVDAEVNLTWDAGTPNIDESTTRSRLQTVFELELRQRGIAVSKAAPNYLTVALTTLNHHSGLVSYAYGLSLYERGFPKRVISDFLTTAIVTADFKRWYAMKTSDSIRASLEMRAKMWNAFWRAYSDTSKTGWVITWSGPAGVITVGRENLSKSLEQMTVELAQAFANAYLAVHPKR